MSSPQQQVLKPKMAAGRTQQDLYRLVCALSGACRADRNVLKDSQLVDLLESQAKAILQTRHQQQRRKSVAPVEAPTISPQRTKLIKKLADASAENDKSASLSKRRKLSFETGTQKRAASPIKPRSFGKMGGGVDLFGKNPAAEAHFAAGSASVTVFNAALIDHMAQRSGALSPPQFYKSGGNAFKSLDHSSVDLSASMASTVVSTSAGYYDDMYDDLSYRRYGSPGLDSEGRGSPCSDLTQSVGSIDWSPTDDEEEDDEEVEQSSQSVSFEPESKPVAIFNPIESVDADVVVSSERKNSTEMVMQVLYSIMHHDQNYKWLVDPENQSRVAKLVEYHQRQQQQNGSVSSSSSSSPSEELQAHVDELVRENARIQSENARLLEVSQMSACDVEEQKKQVHELLQKLQSSVVPVVVSNPASSPSDLERRLAVSEEKLAAQETCRREAETVFESELETKSETVSSLKKELVGKDDEISSLMKQVEAISAAYASKTLERGSFDGSASFSSSTGFRRTSVDADESMIVHLREVNVARETEVKRLRAVLMDKDREMCNLYMHLSTKKKLVEEISSRFLQQVQAMDGSKTLSLDDLNLDLDMFLFKNVVDKQKSVDELTAAVGVMEREVEKLEERVETFEGENYKLKLTQEDLTSTLESANSELLRVSAENELMESSLKEKQTRIRNLMLYLEEKEDQIMRLKDAAEQQLRPAFSSYDSCTY
jgi:regulator of replication initiation timing